jgi:hypothetical protein
LIYREETERTIARNSEAVNRASRLSPPKENSSSVSEARPKTEHSGSAKNIFRKADSKIREESSEQPSLF